MLRLRYPDNLDQYGSLLHPSKDIGLAAGDFDGDQSDEIVTISTEITLIFSAVDDAGTDPCIAAVELGVDGATIDHAIGDHDGDGDDELAVVLDTGVLVIIDGE